eukprot:5418919-Pleurochrysis_carterae.AAC.2
MRMHACGGCMIGNGNRRHKQDTQTRAHIREAPQPSAFSISEGARLVKVRTLPMLLALLPGARVNVAVGVVEGALALALAVAPRAVILAPVLVGHHAEAVLLALFPPALVLSPWGRCLITIIIFGLLAMIEVRTLSFTHAGKIPAGVRIAVWEGGLGLVAAGGGARAEESHLDALVADAHRLGDAGVARAGALAPVSVR